MAHPGGNKYGDKSDHPLTDAERTQVQRFTTDPLAFDEKFTFWLKHNVQKFVNTATGFITRHGSFDSGKGIFPPPAPGPDGTGGLFVWLPGFVYGTSAGGQWSGRWDGSTTGQTQLEALVQPMVHNYNFTGTHFGNGVNLSIVGGGGSGLPYPAAGTWDLVGWIAIRDDVNTSAGYVQVQVNGVDILPYPVRVEKGDENSTHFGCSIGSSYPAPYGNFETDTWDVVFTADDPTKGAEVRLSLQLWPSVMYPNPVNDPTEGMAMKFETLTPDGSSMGFIEMGDTGDIYIEFDLYFPQATKDALEAAMNQYSAAFFNIGRRELPANPGFPNANDLGIEIRHNGSLVYSGATSSYVSNFTGAFNDIRDGKRWMYMDSLGLQDSDNDGNWTYKNLTMTADSDTGPITVHPDTWVTVGLHYYVMLGGQINLLTLGEWQAGAEATSWLFDNLKVATDYWPSEGGTVLYSADFENDYGDLDVSTDVSGNQTTPEVEHPVPGATNGVLGVGASTITRVPRP